MTTFEQQARAAQQEINKVHRDYKTFYELVRGGVVVLVLILVGTFIFTNSDVPDYWTNIYATIVGAVLTVAFLDKRAEQRVIEQRKSELFLQLGSQSNDFALEAKRQLEQLGWLDEALNQKKFLDANWRSISLSRRDLNRAVLRSADLQDAKLGFANLERTDLEFARVC